MRCVRQQLRKSLPRSKTFVPGAMSTAAWKSSMRPPPLPATRRSLLASLTPAVSQKRYASACSACAFLNISSRHQKDFHGRDGLIEIVQLSSMAHSC